MAHRRTATHKSSYKLLLLVFAVSACLPPLGSLALLNQYDGQVLRGVIATAAAPGDCPGAASRLWRQAVP
jgi:hypothetical protein